MDDFIEPLLRPCGEGIKRREEAVAFLFGLGSRGILAIRDNTYARDTGWFAPLAEAEPAEEAFEKFHRLIEPLDVWFVCLQAIEVVVLKDVMK